MDFEKFLVSMTLKQSYSLGDLTYWISTCIFLKNVPMFLEILTTFMIMYENSTGPIDFSPLQPLFTFFKPSLSTIFECSHSLCLNCCDLYKNCLIKDWPEMNPELYSSEIPFFAELISIFKDDIVHDLTAYSFSEIINDKDELGGETRDEKLKKIYTITRYFKLFEADL